MLLTYLTPSWMFIWTSWLICEVIQSARPLLILQDSTLDVFPTLTGLNNKEIGIFRGNVSANFYLSHMEENYFLIGARNVIYNISLATLRENKRINWFSSSNDVEMCLMRQKNPLECQNYIRVIARTSKNELLVCGTNAFRPLCRTYRSTERQNYSLEREENGIAHCPYDPIHNSTAVFVGKKLYSATVADLSGRDSIIFSKPIRTEQHDSQWLNDPNFVSSFAHDDKVYFFFREMAIENINCGKAVFSRVARICAKDAGGSRVLRNTWTTFFKARLNCSIPGEFPFYFDEIQSTSDLGEGSLFPIQSTSDRVHMVYALFSTPRNSLRGTAICAFHFADIISVFEGAYKEQRTAYSNWLPVRESDVPQPHPAKFCPNDTLTLSDQTLNFIKSHPLMDRAVPAFGGQPLIVQTSLNFAFSQIVVDWQVKAANHRYYDILFIGTDDGRVLKAINKGRSSNVETTIIEVIQVFSSRVPITDLKISRGTKRIPKKLIIISRDEIRSVLLHRCHLNTTCSSCVALKDPYCSWLDGKCTNSNLGFQSLETGHYTKCPSDDVMTTTASSTADDESLFHSPCVPCHCQTTFINNSSENSDADHLHPMKDAAQEYEATAESPRINPLQENSSNRNPCFNESLDSRHKGYPIFVVITVALLPSIFTFIVGISIGCYLANRRNDLACRLLRRKLSDVDEKTLRKNSRNEDAQKSEWQSSLASEPRYKVVVNELKTNNSKQPNGAVESTLHNQNSNCL